MPRLVDELDEEDGRFVLERHAGVAVHVIQYLAQIVHLCRDGDRVGPHTGLTEVTAEARWRGIRQCVGPVRAVQLDRAEEHVHTALPRLRDQIVLQVEMVVGDQVASRVGGFPVAPEGQPQAVPAHAGELRHVFVDHFLAIGMEVAGRAIVGGGGEHVVRAEEDDLVLVVAPAHDALVVKEDGTIGALRLHRWRERGEGRQNEPRVHSRRSRMRLSRGPIAATGTYSRSRPSAPTRSVVPLGPPSRLRGV